MCASVIQSRYELFLVPFLWRVTSNSQGEPNPHEDQRRFDLLRCDWFPVTACRPDDSMHRFGCCILKHSDSGFWMSHPTITRCIVGQALYPLELARSRLTTTGSYNGILDCLRKIKQAEGVKGLYTGLKPSVMGILPEAAIAYGCFDLLKQGYARMAGIPEKEVGACPRQHQTRLQRQNLQQLLCRRRMRKRVSPECKP